MIYCNLKESTPVSATYYYGDTVSNLSGEFAVTRSLRLEVIKQPEKCGELTYWLGNCCINIGMILRTESSGKRLLMNAKTTKLRQGGLLILKNRRIIC